MSTTSLYLNMAKAARSASHQLQATTTTQRNNVLLNLTQQLRDNIEAIGIANDKDLSAARIAVEQGSLSSSTFQRLDILGKDGSKLESLIKGVQDVIQLDDPLNQITFARELDQGLELYRVTCPIGVLLIIFEARPEVMIQISSLAIKSGNTVILKGGKEATNVLQTLYTLVQSALKSQNISTSCIQFIQDRSAVAELLDLDKYIDLVIPRGSGSLVKYIKDSTRIPVMGHADGICAIYLDDELPVECASKVVVDSKTQYPAACNAIETILVHIRLLQTPLFSQILKDLLLHKVILKCDPHVLPVARSVAHSSNLSLEMVVEARDVDFDTEFNDLVVAIKVVQNVGEAMVHISEHGSGHTDVILTTNQGTANRFMRGIDSAGVYWNASSRFADGYRYSFGCEVGVSTNRIHARGPVGLEGLVCYKYRMHGHGQAVAEYSGPNKRTYTHLPIEPTAAVQQLVRGE